MLAWILHVNAFEMFVGIEAEYGSFRYKVVVNDELQ